MKNIFLITIGMVMLGIACGNKPAAEQSVKPAPIDSTAKADSILKLKYNKTNWSISIKELARWDSCKARQIDSVVMFILKLPSNWGGTRNAIFGLDSLSYAQVYSYGRRIGDDYYNFLHTPPPPVQVVEPPIYPMTEKPVIYLYPTKQQDITVKLDLKGKLAFTWPQISTGNTWNVKAAPDGMLNSNGQDYPYLFWDGVQDDMSYIKQNEGFVIKGTEAGSFLTDKLTLLGLNARERADFITYWAPRMASSDYFFIRFETTAYSKAVPLTITPAPESMQRIMMVFKAVDKDYKHTPQTLTPFTRKGYTVIEWGGAELPSIAF
ncbi:MAG: hypothetical protein M0D57_18485 [Sphingobacteriales bacterium JAD_PAG50586_3]|nr:MAG: hypothetical protein M0D57_18485 [Sphingobacteriales bacterium JAD_PAG50586_3]